ncbi:MAG: hypothetical protein DDT22_01366 [candidate division WS2 bacterium]|nr:hypothetical protein [Candidatus Lithacetigena glycinireducens]
MVKVNTKKKGKQFEYWCKKWLEKQGYQVHLAGKRALYIGGKTILAGADFFGCDIVALHPEEKVLFVQATYHSDIKKKLDKLAKYKFPLQHCKVQVWQKVGESRIRILEYDGKELIVVAEIQRGKVLFYKINNET